MVEVVRLLHFHLSLGILLPLFHSLFWRCIILEEEDMVAMDTEVLDNQCGYLSSFFNEIKFIAVMLFLQLINYVFFYNYKES